MKNLLLVCVFLSLTGCSAITGLVASEAADTAVEAVTGKKDKKGISVDTEIVAGDKEQTGQLGNSNDSEVKLDDVEVNGTLNTSSTTKGKENNVDASNASKVEINDGVEFWQAGIMALLALLLGLAAPQFKVVRKEKLNG